MGSSRPRSKENVFRETGRRTLCRKDGKSNASALYVPCDSRLRIRGKGEIAFFEAPALKEKPSFFISDKDVKAVSRGLSLWRRDVVTLITPKDGSSNLAVGETSSPPGLWSGNAPSPTRPKEPESRGIRSRGNLLPPFHRKLRRLGAPASDHPAPAAQHPPPRSGQLARPRCARPAPPRQRPQDRPKDVAELLALLDAVRYLPPDARKETETDVSALSVSPENARKTLKLANRKGIWLGLLAGGLILAALAVWFSSHQPTKPSLAEIGDEAYTLYEQKRFAESAPLFDQACRPVATVDMPLARHDV